MIEMIEYGKKRRVTDKKLRLLKKFFRNYKI